MTKTLFVSDLDGTLLNEKADISDKAADILNDLIENGLNLKEICCMPYILIFQTGL